MPPNVDKLKGVGPLGTYVVLRKSSQIRLREVVPSAVTPTKPLYVPSLVLVGSVSKRKCTREACRLTLASRKIPAGRNRRKRFVVMGEIQAPLGRIHREAYGPRLKSLNQPPP